MTDMCFTCKIMPAGNVSGGPFSAYCANCQPIDDDQPPKGSQCECGSCGLTFAALSDFDSHKPGICLKPDEIGLKVRNGVYGTPEGNANRDRLARDLANRRSRQA